MHTARDHGNHRTKRMGFHSMRREPQNSNRPCYVPAHHSLFLIFLCLDCRPKAAVSGLRPEASAVRSATAELHEETTSRFPMPHQWALTNSKNNLYIGTLTVWWVWFKPRTTGNKTPGQQKAWDRQSQTESMLVRCRGSLPLHCFAAIVLWLGPGMISSPRSCRTSPSWPRHFCFDM